MIILRVRLLLASSEMCDVHRWIEVVSEGRGCFSLRSSHGGSQSPEHVIKNKRTSAWTGLIAADTEKDEDTLLSEVDV